MSDSGELAEVDAASKLEVRTYFVRHRNALLARAAFSDLYVDYYLHQGQISAQHAPFHDGMLKEALAAMTLHSASRPWNESCAWTVHFQKPLINLFVAGDNPTGTVIGQILSENVKDTGQNLFFADLTREGKHVRRSSVEFTGLSAFAAVEQYYEQSEQRPARFFEHSEEDYVMVTAQPDCDLEWFAALTPEAIRTLDKTEELSLLERRFYQWKCGCTQERMMSVLKPVMAQDPEGLFGSESVLRMRCRRCGWRYVITRESLEAYMAG